MGGRLSKLEKRFTDNGVSQAAVSRIRNRVLWAEVP
jgi:hypothetical protein